MLAALLQLCRGASEPWRLIQKLQINLMWFNVFICKQVQYRRNHHRRKFQSNGFCVIFSSISNIPSTRTNYSAMVTSTSTPDSIGKDVICLTISDGLCRSIIRLCILIWNLSHVLELSPQGDFRVVIRRVLVGIRTGPLTRKFFSLASPMSLVHTFSKDGTSREFKVIRILWTGASCKTNLVVSLYDTLPAWLRWSDRRYSRRTCSDSFCLQVHLHSLLSFKALKAIWKNKCAVLNYISHWRHSSVIKILTKFSDHIINQRMVTVMK